ncbi:MAG: fibronectin type III domain-containing protein [Ignavibacteriaceae bacterium]|nr:fibronectin type III domain-containing protein [Ignavibacteriaceae bacterium]
MTLEIPDYGIVNYAGRPCLPQISFNLMINKTETDISAVVNQEVKRTQNLDYHIFPYQRPWLKTNALKERPFDYDKEYYASIGDPNQTGINISEPFIIGGVRGVTVTIYPFAYNPSEKILTMVEHGEYKVKLSSPVENINDHSAIYNEYLQTLFVNFEAGSTRLLSNYLIITAPEYEAALAPFVAHKNSIGYNVDLFTTAVTGTSTATIKTFIQNRYNNPGTKPEFILLVGDVDKIPSWIGTGEGAPHTDLNYVQLEGVDYFADASIGRFSVINTSQLQNAIDKTIFMENYIGTLTKKNVFFASSDNYSISQGTHNFIIDTYFTPNSYTNLKLYSHSGATTQQSINALNDNQIFAIYSGHGSETSWADGPPLSQSQVSALTNTVYPFVYSFACVTGSYHLTESFGETWLRVLHGASSFYGSSENSYWDEDDILERGIFKALFVDNLTKVTPMFDKGKFYLINYYGGSVTSGSTLLRYLEMYNLMGDPSLSTKKVVLPDTTPPEAITDLSVGNPTSSSLTLNWSAPYDSTFGGIVSYDIRYSTNPILNDNDFNAAPRMVFGNQSDTAGTHKSFAITNLAAGTPYYFSVKAQDLWNNNSPISNNPNASTFQAPTLLVTPSSLNCIMSQGTVDVDTVWINNITANSSTLDYDIQFANNTFPNGIIGARVIPVPSKNQNAGINEKNSNEVNFGQSIKGSGGPDNFGYEWIDSDEPNGPAYVWNDIAATGTPVTNWIPTGTFGPTDEGYAGPINLGFNFKFYGGLKTEVYLSSNGFITFAPITSNTFTNSSIPSSGVPDEIISPFWDDLDAKSPGTVYYKQDGNKMIIQWTNYQRYSGTASYTFQVVLFSSGKINIYYNNITGTLNACTVGIENASGSDGLQVAYNAAYLKNNLAVQIAAEPDWLVGNGNMNGTLYNGNSAAIELTFQTEDYPNGNYGMDMVITSNDPVNPTITVPVAMTIQAIPVELTSFDAVGVRNDAVLSWETATETNNMGFKIEKKSESDNWIEAGWIQGKGTSTEKTKYSFTDKNLKPGKYEYRIKQIDFDGKFDFSESVEVEVGKPNTFVLEQNYPNPFNPSTVIDFAVPEKSQVTITIFNSLGEVIETLVNELKDAGYYKLQFNGTNLASGTYFYQINATGVSGNFTSVKKMLLIK